MQGIDQHCCEPVFPRVLSSAEESYCEVTLEIPTTQLLQKYAFKKGIRECWSLLSPSTSVQHLLTAQWKGPGSAINVVP